MKKSKRPFKRWEKTIKEDRDWDYVFMWILERKKLQHMLKYWTEYWHDVVHGSEFCDSYQSKTLSVISELKTCIKLLDICIDERDCVWDCVAPKTTTVKVPGKELWQLVHVDPDDHGTYTKIGYVNLRNARRVIGGSRYDSIMGHKKSHDDKEGFPNYMSCQYENEIYRDKARHLYYVIRETKETGWWE